MKANECVEAVTSELDRAGIKYRVDWTRTHVHVHYGPELQHLHVTASTPSDHRAPLNERAQIRRELKKLGYVETDAQPELEVIPVSLIDGGPVCFSQDIAVIFGKAHKDVLRAIDRVRTDCGPEFDRRNFAPVEYRDGKGRAYRAFRMSRDGFSLVAMGFTGAQATAWKVKFIAAFNAMEAELARLANASVDLQPIRTEMDALVALIGDVEARLPAPSTPNVPPQYLLGLTRPQRRKIERRLRRRAA